jgi:hypothetical protein
VAEIHFFRWRGQSLLNFRQNFQISYTPPFALEKTVFSPLLGQNFRKFINFPWRWGVFAFWLPCQSGWFAFWGVPLPLKFRPWTQTRVGDDISQDVIWNGKARSTDRRWTRGGSNLICKERCRFSMGWCMREPYCPLSYAVFIMVLGSLRCRQRVRLRACFRIAWTEADKIYISPEHTFHRSNLGYSVKITFLCCNTESRT